MAVPEIPLMLLGIRPLGNLTLGDAPRTNVLPPPFLSQASDIIVGESSTPPLRIDTFDIPITLSPRPSLIDLFNKGAIFVFATTLDVANAPAAFAAMTFTAPDGTFFTAASPRVYVGMPDVATYRGTLEGETYLVYVFQPGILTRGLWNVLLQFRPYPQGLPLTDRGTFTVP